MFIWFDLDGVIADLVRGSFAIHGRSLPIMETRYDYWPDMGLTDEEFFKPMERAFWANLPLMDDGFLLLKHCERRVGVDNIGILTYPCEMEGCYDGKKAWVRKWIPQHEKHLFAGGAKWLVSGPGKILIDDHDTNCEKWQGRPNGGVAVTVPRPWNKRIGECNAVGEFDTHQLCAEVDALLRGRADESNVP